MKYSEIFKNIENKKHCLVMLAAGCEHEKGIYSDTFEDMILAIKERRETNDYRRLQLTPEEIKKALDSHMENSEKLDEITNQSIMLNIKKLLGDSRETEEFVFELLEKHKNIKVHEEHPFVNQSHPVTSFSIDDYLMTYQKHFNNLKSTDEYLNHIAKLLLLNKDMLGMEDLVVFQKQDQGREYHQYFATSINDKPVSSEVLYNIFDKAMNVIQEKLENKKNTDMNEDITDIILFCKLEKDLPVHDFQESKMKI